MTVSSRLPDYPWDQLRVYADRARAHPGGIVDLSIGTPVDSTPDVVQQALCDAADSPGYPTTLGRVDTRQACLDWLSGSHGVTGLGLDQVLPVIGSKELIASMALHLGLGPGDLVAFPRAGLPDLRGGGRARRCPCRGRRHRR